MRGSLREGLLLDYSKDIENLPGRPHAQAECRARCAAWSFESLSSPQVWKQFSRSPEALLLRKNNRFGAAFNEVGEDLQLSAVRTVYKGVLQPLPSDPNVYRVTRLEQASEPVYHVVVSAVHEERPRMVSVAGETLADYSPQRDLPLPRYLPFKVCFDGQDFPHFEIVSRLESPERRMSLAEALVVSGVSAQELETVLYQSLWIASWLRGQCLKAGTALRGGHLNWALGEDSHPVLVSPVELDDLKLDSLEAFSSYVCEQSRLQFQQTESRE